MSFSLPEIEAEVTQPRIETVLTPEGKTITLVEIGKKLLGFQIPFPEGRAAIPRADLLFTEYYSYDS